MKEKGWIESVAKQALDIMSERKEKEESSVLQNLYTEMKEKSAKVGNMKFDQVLKINSKWLLTYQSCHEKSAEVFLLM